jgi:hypothetical protein
VSGVTVVAGVNIGHTVAHVWFVDLLVVVLRHVIHFESMCPTQQLYSQNGRPAPPS